MHLELNNILCMLLTLSMHRCGEHELVGTCMTHKFFELHFEISDYIRNGFVLCSFKPSRTCQSIRHSVQYSFILRLSLLHCQRDESSAGKPSKSDGEDKHPRTAATERKKGKKNHIDEAEGTYFLLFTDFSVLLCPLFLLKSIRGLKPHLEMC